MDPALAADNPGIATQEDDLCKFYIAAMAEARRSELRALYAIAGRLHAHKSRTQNRLRESLMRCGGRLGKDRTTLLRYAFVYQRIKAEEFAMLISLCDRRGYPPTFWDLVDVAERSREMRLSVLIARLAERDGGHKSKHENPPHRRDTASDPDSTHGRS
jgi:hypothetical protein